MTLEDLVYRAIKWKGAEEVKVGIVGKLDVEMVGRGRGGYQDGSLFQRVRGYIKVDKIIKLIKERAEGKERE